MDGPDDPGKGIYFIGDGHFEFFLYLDEELSHLLFAVVVGYDSGSLGGLAVESVAGVEERD